MNLIRKLCTVIDTITEATGRVFAFIVLATQFTVLFEVVARKLFNHPQIWTMDIILYTYGIYFALVLAYGFLNKSYVRVDILSATWPHIVEHIVHLVTYVIFMWPFLFWVMYRSFSFAAKSFALGERNYSVWLPPLWPVKLLFAAGLVLLNLQALSETLKEVLWIWDYHRGGRQAPPPIGSMSLLKPMKSSD